MICLGHRPSPFILKIFRRRSPSSACTHHFPPQHALALDFWDLSAFSVWFSLRSGTWTSFYDISRVLNCILCITVTIEQVVMMAQGYFMSKISW